MLNGARKKEARPTGVSRAGKNALLLVGTSLPFLLKSFGVPQWEIVYMIPE